jgi:hypothetical protein
MASEQGNNSGLCPIKGEARVTVTRYELQRDYAYILGSFFSYVICIYWKIDCAPLADTAHAERVCAANLLSGGNKSARSACYHCWVLSSSVCVKNYQVKPLIVVGHKTQCVLISHFST